MSTFLSLTKGQLHRAAATLQELAQDGPSDPLYGICSNWQHLGFLFSYDVVEELAVDWPERTGSGRAYPIKRELDPYEDRLPLWEGSQLAQRESLMAYMAERIAGRIRELESSDV